jgi:galactosamine-6-phosphate isomerase
MVDPKISSNGKNSRSIMNISYFSNANAMSQKAAAIVLEALDKNPELLLCAATGSTPKMLYQLLGEKAQRPSTFFQKTRIIPLDEWIGLATPKGSCHAYIQEQLLVPLQISKDRYFGFNAEADDLDKECERIQKSLQQEGPIDLCILGLGKNGHLGFNEPATELKSHCHVATLALQSQEHTMIGSASTKPTKGLTLGMQDILNAKKILLLVSGDGKTAVTHQLLSGSITNDCPATWLWKHSQVECLIEHDIAKTVT